MRVSVGVRGLSARLGARAAERGRARVLARARSSQQLRLLRNRRRGDDAGLNDGGRGVVEDGLLEPFEDQ